MTYKTPHKRGFRRPSSAQDAQPGFVSPLTLCLIAVATVVAIAIAIIMFCPIVACNINANHIISVSEFKFVAMGSYGTIMSIPCVIILPPLQSEQGQTFKIP